MKYTKYIIGVCLAAALLISCVSNKLDTNFSEAALVGKITDKDNQPCSNVTVTMDNFFKTTSDINGTFYLSPVTRGKHTFKFTKDGYKEEIREYEFLNISQVIYQKMISMEQILEEIEKDISQKKYEIAQDYIEEGKAIDPANPVLNYLHGVLYYRLARYDLAIQKFESILQNGFTEPYIYLTLTDIYEYEKADYTKAHEYILKYLDLVDDNAAKLREIIIKNNMKKNDNASPDTETSSPDTSTEPAVPPTTADNSEESQ